MDTSPQIQRAVILHEQGRHDMAEKELRQLLTTTPENAFALALLAISLAELQRRDEAEAAARQAIGHEPDMAFAHYSLARVMADRNRPEDASAAIREAVRLEPDDADYHGMQAAIELSKEHWQTALEAAETGLQMDPEHVNCSNLRAMALVKLGRKSEAGITIDSTLSREPENSFSHANKGWTLLEQGRRKEALAHFQESLRLEPGNEWAREGLVQALKAGNPIYAVVLKYFLWMQKLSVGARWGILLGGYFGSRVLGGLARSNPEWAPWIAPVRFLYISFALLTWLAAPIFNLFLFAHPLGRHALNPEERRQALSVGLCLAIAMLLVLGALNPAFRTDNLLSAMIVGLLSIPVSAIYSCHEGWPRKAMGLIATTLGIVGGSAAAILGIFHPPTDSDMAGIGNLLTGLFFLGTFISMWVANFLSTRRPER
jgi:tetratricopeptide (TPR) repeat protein